MSTEPAAARPDSGRVFFTRLRAARARRAAVRDTIRNESAYLVPGTYVMAGETLWRRRGTTLPEHLRSTKAWQHASRSERLREAVRRAVLPSTFRVVRTSSGEHRYPLAVVAFDGAPVLLDPTGGTVARFRANTPPRAAELRARLARHVPTPRFEEREGGRVVVEDFVPGTSLATLGPEDLWAVLRLLARRWAALTAGEAEGTWDSLLRATLSSCAGIEVPPLVGAALAHGFPTGAEGWPMVPSAPDAKLRNVVLSGDRGPVLIDLGDVRLDPAHSYLLGAVADGGPAALDRYLAGDLDDELAAIVGRPAAAWPPEPWSHIDALAVRTCVVTYQETGARRQLLEDGIRRRWTRVERTLRSSAAAPASPDAT